MNLSTLEVLSEKEIRDIHKASIDILTKCGVKVLNNDILSKLKEMGLIIDQEKQIVVFTKNVIEDAISKIVPRFEVYNRDKKYAYIIGDGNSKIAAGHNAIFWVDDKKNERRSATIKDIELFSRICDNLEYIDMIGIPAMPQDIKYPWASLVYGVKAVIENSNKPIYYSTDSSKVNKIIIELIQQAFKGDIQNQIYGIAQFSPTSPLYWEDDVLNAMIDSVIAGIPVAILPEPNAGISAPYTLAGLLTLNNAEWLSGLAILHLIKPGSKIMYANSWTTTDMRNGAALVGSTETSICRIAGAQIARFYNAPSHTTAPNSDNHAHDEQNAWEKTFSMFSAVAAKNDLIVNCGMFATGLTCSYEQLIMDEEISAMAKRISKGIRVNKETIATELIIDNGPGQTGDSYLTAENTLKWIHSDEYLPPRISVREPFAIWVSEGGKDTYQLAQDKVKEYLAMDSKLIDENLRLKLNEILSGYNLE